MILPKAEEAERRKVEERRRRERENMAGLRGALQQAGKKDAMDIEVMICLDWSFKRTFAKMSHGEGIARPKWPCPL